MELREESILDEISVKKKQRLLTWSLAIGIIICIALMLTNEYYANQISVQPLDEFTKLVTFLWKR
jgi:hypothetical protein